VDLQTTLSADLQRLQSELAALGQDVHWVSVDPKYPNSVLESTQHIQLVWDAFTAALTQTQAAALDTNLPLPAVPAWADQLRVVRGEVSAVVAPKPTVDAAVKAENKQAQAAIKAAAQLQKQQADAVRTDLVAKAEALMKPVRVATIHIAARRPRSAPYVTRMRRRSRRTTGSSALTSAASRCVEAVRLAIPIGAAGAFTTRGVFRLASKEAAANSSAAVRPRFTGVGRTFFGRWSGRKRFSGFAMTPPRDGSCCCVLGRIAESA
jgi:hypothetical protein